MIDGISTLSYCYQCYCCCSCCLLLLPVVMIEMTWSRLLCCAVLCCVVQFCSWWWVDYSSNYLSAFWYYSSFMRSKWDQLSAIHTYILYINIYLLSTDHRTLAHSTAISISGIRTTAHHSSLQLSSARLSSSSASFSAEAKSNLLMFRRSARCLPFVHKLISYSHAI